MIDIRAARNDPERFRAALARRGAAEAFDELMDADARWRELVPQVDELRAKQKLQGKPTPEQLEELKARKTRLNELEAELAAAEAARDAALVKVPNPPHESAADGMTEDDAVEIRRWGEPPQLAEPKEHTEIGRFELERAAKVSGSRFGFLLARIHI
jgi:seryl-tRNA synthetase